MTNLIRKWYTDKQLDRLIPYLTFIELPIWLKLGVYQKYLAEIHHCTVMADSKGYSISGLTEKCILYIEKANSMNIVYVALNNADVFTNYELAINKVSNLINKPPF